ncbi:hypothetical protein FRC18_004850 [Serendipita sp. 400]|nr:hypothetical protein FRC18_004850 [Serendipita sp. 400]
MYGLVDRVEIHPANQSFVDLYLNSSTLEELDRLIKSVTPYTEANTAVLEEKIRGYVDKEEERLKSNLQKVDWNIDGLDTLSLITGRGRIERYIFPLLYLVLRRHFWMLRLACQDTFPADVLQIPTQSISTLMSAVSTRIRNLSVVLKQRSADPSALVGNVAFGMFKLLNDSKLAVDELDDDSYLAEFGSGDIPEEELKSITQAGSLFGPLSNNSGYGEVESLKFDQDEFPEGDGILNGVWTGYNYYSDDDRSDGLMQFNIIHTEGSKLRGTGIDRVDVYHMEGEVTSTTENGLDFILKLAYGPQPSEGEETWAFEFTGSFDTSTLEARGNWASVGYPPFGPFLLTRRPTFAYPFLYSKSELSENRARARWKFALTTIRQQIRRQRWSWSYFKDRMEQRKRYVELRLRMDIEQLYNVNAAVRLSSDEILELNSTGERLHPADGRYYMSLAKKAMRMLCIHSRTNGLYCDGCYSGIIGQRMLCLECVKPDFSNHVDMCEFCIDDPASNNSFEHKSSHDSLLLFRALHDRKKKATVTNSKMFITAGKDALGSSDNKIECVSCSCPIEMPCWLCIEWECGCDAFVCATCQKKKDATYKKDSHKATHSLVRLSHNVAPSKQTVEETIGSLNSRLTEDLADVRSRVEKLEETVGGYEAKINQRITALEGMVEQRLSKMEELLLRVLTAVSLAESSG